MDRQYEGPLRPDAQGGLADPRTPGSCSDLPGGDMETLIASIRQQLLALPDETVVYPGHGPETTIGAERAANPYLGE